MQTRKGGSARQGQGHKTPFCILSTCRCILVHIRTHSTCRCTLYIIHMHICTQTESGQEKVVVRGKVKDAKRHFAHQAQLRLSLPGSPNISVKVFSTGRLQIAGCRYVYVCVYVYMRLITEYKLQRIQQGQAPHCWMQACAYARMRVYVHAYIQCMHVGICVCMHVCVCVYVRMQMCLPGSTF